MLVLPIRQCLDLALQTLNFFQKLIELFFPWLRRLRSSDCNDRVLPGIKHLRAIHFFPSDSRMALRLMIRLLCGLRLLDREVLCCNRNCFAFSTEWAATLTAIDETTCWDIRFLPDNR